MIFLTVGTQLPFDRLVKAVDRAAKRLSLTVVGQTGNGKYRPEYICGVTEMSPIEYDEYMRSARIIVSHAGIGTILAAKREKKPLIIMPRRACYGEHRNDHQLATVSQLRGRPGLYVAADDVELEKWLEADLLPPPDAIEEPAPLRQLRSYLDEYIKNTG